MEEFELQKALLHVIATSGSNGTSSGNLMHIDRSSGRDAFLLKIVPLSNSMGELDQNFHGALAFCIDPEETRHISTRGMKQIYSLRVLST